jgi:GAF domain-containing protein
MDVATHLEIVSIFGHWARGHESAAMLLQRTLDIARQQGIDLTAAHLYQLEEANRRWIISATSNETIIPAASVSMDILSDEESIYAQAQDGSAVFDAVRRLWICATGCSEAPDALVEWILSTTAEVNSVQQDWVELLSRALGQALDMRALRASLSSDNPSPTTHKIPTSTPVTNDTLQVLASQLVDVNLAISRADSVGAMLDAMMSILPADIGTSLVITFDDFAPATPHSLMTLCLEAVATHTTSANFSIRHRLTTPLNETNFPLLWPTTRGQVVNLVRALGNVPSLEGFVPTIRQYFDSFEKDHQVIGLPLMTSDQPFGMLVFLADHSMGFDGIPRETLRALTSQLSIAIENRRLFQQTSETLKSVSDMYEMSTVLHYAQEPEEMLWVLYQLVMRHYSHAQLLLFNENTGRAEIAGEIGVEDEPIKNLPEDYDEKITRELFGADPMLVSRSGQILMVPLRTADQRIIGFVRLINLNHPVEIGATQMRALRSLADQMATSLQNMALLQETERSLLEALTLYEMNAALLKSGDDTPSILSNIFEHLTFDADQLILFSIRYDQNDRIDHFILEASASRTSKQWIERDLLQEIDQTTCDYVLETWKERGDRIYFNPQPADDPISTLAVRYYIEQQGGSRVSSNVVIPLLDDGFVTHLLVVLYELPHRFQETTQRMYYTMRDQFTLILKNIQLLQTTRASVESQQRQLRTLQILNVLATRLTTTEDIQAIYNTVCQTYYEAIGADHVGMTILNPDGQSATVVSEYPAQNMVGLQIAADNPLQERIRQMRDPIYLPNIQESTELADVSKIELTRVGLKSLIFIPMIDRENQYLGAIGLDYFEEQKKFPQDLIDLAQTINSQVVTSLQNMRQIVRIRRQAEQLEVLAELSRDLQSQLDVMTITRLVAERLPSLLALDHLHMLFFDTSTGTLRPTIERYQDEIINLPSLRSSIPIEMTTAGRVWVKREPSYVAVMEKEDHVQHLFRNDLQSVMTVPLQARGLTQGIIEVASHTPFQYTETDQTIFLQFANILSAALENAEIYTQSQRIARSKALINDIASQIQRQTDLEQVLGVTMNELGRALGAKQGRIRIGRTPKDERENPS